MVLAPQANFYDKCVLLLDFNSLYPGIIRTFGSNYEEEEIEWTKKFEVSGFGK